MLKPKLQYFGHLMGSVGSLDISVLHLLTLSGRFRVGFGVGHIYNIHNRALTFRDRPRIFEF